METMLQCLLHMHDYLANYTIISNICQNLLTKNKQKFADYLHVSNFDYVYAIDKI